MRWHTRGRVCGGIRAGAGIAEHNLVMKVYVSIGLPGELVGKLRPDAIMYCCLMRLTAQGGLGDR